MAYVISEQQMLDGNIFKYEERMNSSITRFLDKTPTFVVYYHINNLESTKDEGFLDIESIISSRSPLRFQRIDNFPLYGLEPIVLQLQDNEEGLNSDYQGDGVILPNTIKPVPNDFFIVKILKGVYLFRVTEIGYDSIRPDNFYKINFRLEYNDEEKIARIEEQVYERFSCKLENIGTELSCIVEESDNAVYTALQNMYDDMANTYISLFYSEKYNAFIGNALGGYKLFDPLQSVFANKHRLFNKSNNLKTIILSEGFEDKRRRIRYEKSIYRFFERQDSTLVNPFLVNIFPGIYKKDSAFARWHDQSVYVIDIPLDSGTACTQQLLPDRIVQSFKYNAETDSKYVELMRRFIRKEEITINDIPLDLNEEIITLGACQEVYLFTPILLYILKKVFAGYGK